MSMAVRMQLAAELTRMREEAGLSQAEAGSKKICDVKTIRAIERAERPVKSAYVKLLCELYAPDDQPTLDRLLVMAANKAKGWWEPHAKHLDPKFRFLVQAESAAAEVCTYDSELLYGLLQTPTYHRALYDADPSAPASQVEREVAFRTERQKAALGRNPPLRITTILNAAVLERRFPAMDEQRAHLRAMNLNGHIDLSVLPWDAGPHVAMTGSFKIIRFGLKNVPDVAYNETDSGVYYTEDPDAVQIYTEKFRRITQQAVPLEEYL